MDFFASLFIEFLARSRWFFSIHFFSFFLKSIYVIFCCLMSFIIFEVLSWYIREQQHNDDAKNTFPLVKLALNSLIFFVHRAVNNVAVLACSNNKRIFMPISSRNWIKVTENKRWEGKRKKKYFYGFQLIDMNSRIFLFFSCYWKVHVYCMPRNFSK